MKFPPPLRAPAPLALLITYVAAVSATPPIDAPPESSFAIASSHDSRPTSSGGSVIYNPTHAANLDDPGAFAVRVPGESIGVAHWHDLPATYSFTQPGAGDDSTEPSNPFTYVDADDTPKDLHATVEGVAKVKLSGDLVTRRQVHDKRFRSGSKPKFAHCSPVKKQMIKEAVKDAQGALEEAIAQIDSEDHGTSFTTWFGRVPDLSYIVRKNLEGFKILLDFSGYTFDCNCGDNFPSEIIPHHKKVRICEPFWKLMPGPKSVEIFRMAARRDESIETTAVGLAAARRLIMEYPFDAIWNLENYVALIWQEADPFPPPYGSHPPPYHNPPPHGPPPPYGG